MSPSVVSRKGFERWRIPQLSLLSLLKSVFVTSWAPLTRLSLRNLPCLLLQRIGSTLMICVIELARIYTPMVFSDTRMCRHLSCLMTPVQMIHSRYFGSRRRAGSLSFLAFSYQRWLVSCLLGHNSRDHYGEQAQTDLTVIVTLWQPPRSLDSRGQSSFPIECHRSHRN